MKKVTIEAWKKCDMTQRFSWNRDKGRSRDSWKNRIWIRYQNILNYLLC